MGDEEKTKQIQELDVRRRQQKAAITRFVNALTQHIAEEDINCVQEGLAKLTSSFRKLEDIQDRYNEMLDSADDIETSDNYFFDVQTKYINSLKTANGWNHKLIQKQTQSQKL